MEVISSAVRPTHISEEDMEAKSANIEEIIMLDPECLNLDLNHGRIKTIDGLEPLVRIERYKDIFLQHNLIFIFFL